MYMYILYLLHQNIQRVQHSYPIIRSQLDTVAYYLVPPAVKGVSHDGRLVFQEETMRSRRCVDHQVMKGGDEDKQQSCVIHQD